MRITILGTLTESGWREYRVAVHSEELFRYPSSEPSDARIICFDDVLAVFGDLQPYLEWDAALKRAEELRGQLGSNTVIDIAETRLTLFSGPYHDRGF